MLQKRSNASHSAELKRKPQCLQTRFVPLFNYTYRFHNHSKKFNFRTQQCRFFPCSLCRGSQTTVRETLKQTFSTVLTEKIIIQDEGSVLAVVLRQNKFVVQIRLPYFFRKYYFILISLNASVIPS